MESEGSIISIALPVNDSGQRIMMGDKAKQGEE